ncbi:MAG TPA: ferritin [bacterium]|nr:ferritin [bacterium]HOL49755.1 ferritin [bacterium]HPO52355.1 ferritin [bacterium]HXK44327.1 ferritin [bacterium]
MEKNLQKAMNEQIRNELYSAYLYLSMAAYCESKNLSGIAHWLKVQAKEEVSHAMKFFEFMVDVGAEITLLAIDQPPTDFASVTEIFEKTLEHEKKVTAMINNLVSLAQKAGDNPAMIMLQWFVNEQVEEEKNASQILETLKMIKEQGPAIVMLDRELGKREG